MSKLYFKLTISFLLILSACAPISTTPNAFAPDGDVQGKVEIISIDENDAVSIQQVIQEKTIAHCKGAGSLNAEISFSQSNNETSEKKLIIEGGGSAGFEIPMAVRIELEGAIQNHFSTTVSSGETSTEVLKIEVPPHTHEIYTIVWQKIRRAGVIRYIQNGEEKLAEFNYLLGIELVSLESMKVVCPDITPSNSTGNVTATAEAPKTPIIVLPNSPTLAPTKKPTSVSKQPSPVPPTIAPITTNKCSVTSFSVSPSSGSVGSTFTLSGSGQCDGGVRAVRFLIDGVPFGEFGGPNHTTPWGTSGVSAGNHQIGFQVASGDWSDAATKYTTVTLK